MIQEGYHSSVNRRNHTFKMASTQSGMVNPAIFEHLQVKIDQDARVREELRNKLQILEKQG